MAKNTGLGKGINALFTDIYTDQNDNIDNIDNIKSVSDNLEVTDKVIELKLTEIEPNMKQARKHFDERKLQELAESIKNFGVIQPILVSKKDGYYEIIAGERRWRASKLAGLRNNSCYNKGG